MSAPTADISTDRSIDAFISSESFMAGVFHGVLRNHQFTKATPATTESPSTGATVDFPAGLMAGGVFSKGEQMSIPLIDLRAKITIETDAVLEAVQRATGKDKSEVVRDVLHKWAASEIHASNVLHTILRREGIGGASEGGPGK